MAYKGLVPMSPNTTPSAASANLYMLPCETCCEETRSLTGAGVAVAAESAATLGVLAGSCTAVG
jgi:hypothetical protein